MPGISRFAEWVAREVDPEGAPECHAQPLPRIERVTAAKTPLDRTDRRSGQPREGAELGLRQAAAQAGGPDLPAQPGELLAVPASRLCGNVRRPALDHDRCMVADRTSPALMRFSSLPVRDAADVLSMLPSVGRPCSGRGARNAAWVSLAAWAPTAIRMPSRSR